MEITAILQPVFVIALLTVVMTVWMFFTRIPAMARLRIHPQKGQETQQLKGLLPKEVTRISNNYNHLFEQPTLFYAVAISIALLNDVDAIHVYCAWTYAITRIVHSLVQATADIVLVRFGVFIVSWLVLSMMIIRGSMTVFGF